MTSLSITQTYSMYTMNERSNTAYDIVFKEDSHSYYVKENDIYVQQPSVTQIITAVFGNRFARANPVALAKATGKGKLVHKEILDYTMHPNSAFGMTPEFRTAANEIRNIHTISDDRVAPEQVLFCDNPYAKFCCTIDAFWLCSELLVDYKTSKVLHKDYVKRQLNLYAYALRKNGWKVKLLQAWHLVGDAFNIHRVDLCDDTYCECILRAYSEGKTFKNDKEMLEYYLGKKEEDNSPKTILELLLDKVRDIDNAIDKLNKSRENLIEHIKTEMNDIKQTEYVYNDMTARYFPQNVRVSFDKSRFELENPELYAKYMTKETKVKDFVRINYKKETK